jgi:hypothetical protein
MTTNPVRIVRAIICSAGVFAAVAIVGGMSILNYRFASKLTDDPLDQIVYGLMAVAIVVVGTIIWLMIEAAWAKRARATAAFLAFAGVVFASWALTMSAGHIGSNRLTANSTAHFDGGRVAALQNDEKRIQAELVSLGGYRDAGRIEADLKIMRDSFAWVQTDGCKAQKSASQRKFCKAYADRQGELSTAKRAGQLATEVKTVQAQIASLGAHKVGDGQAKVLSGIILASNTSNDAAEDQVSRYLSLAQAVVSLFAELTIVRILIMLFGWKPEDLVGGISNTLQAATDTAPAAPVKDRWLSTHLIRTAEGIQPRTAVVA